MISLRERKGGILIFVMFVIVFLIITITTCSVISLTDLKTRNYTNLEKQKFYLLESVWEELYFEVIELIDEGIYSSLEKMNSFIEIYEDEELIGLSEKQFIFKKYFRSYILSNFRGKIENYSFELEALKKFNIKTNIKGSIVEENGEYICENKLIIELSDDKGSKRKVVMIYVKMPEPENNYTVEEIEKLISIKFKD